MQDLDPVKQKLGVPKELTACHTAQVDAYVIEGHANLFETDQGSNRGSAEIRDKFVVVQRISSISITKRCINLTLVSPT